MGLINKISDAYNRLFNNDKSSEKYIESDSSRFGFMDFSEIEDMDESTMDDNQSMISSLSKEMRTYVNNDNNRLIPPKIVPIKLLTDSPTATDVIALLGMVRWAMEHCGNSSDDNKEYKFTVTVKNRGQSPLLISVGDTPVAAIPVQTEYSIGN